MEMGKCLEGIILQKSLSSTQHQDVTDLGDTARDEVSILPGACCNRDRFSKTRFLIVSRCSFELKLGWLGTGRCNKYSGP